MENKKRLIDANALFKAIKSFRWFGNTPPSTLKLMFDYLKLIIKEQPTVDAVAVVRCKDCTKISPSVTPIKDAVWCREFRAYMPCNGFCSYGERREGE